MKLHYERPGLALWQGHAAGAPLALEPGSVQCVVTSPPYWGLRDYGVPGQLGAESDVRAYVANVVYALGEVRKVLADDGVPWLNLGDTYAPNWSSKRARGGGGLKSDAPRERVTRYPGFTPKTLMGVPWRIALELIDDGWILRSEVIWAKPNPMPESVTDRPTRSHEQLFMLTKKPRYYYDAAAIAEPAIYANDPRAGKGRQTYSGGRAERVDEYVQESFVSIRQTRNKRDVWSVPTKPFKGAHFATFPPALIEPCVLSSSRPSDLVLDPFSGSGTTGAVALEHGRRYVGIDLNAEYLDLSLAHRFKEGS